MRVPEYKHDEYTIQTERQNNGLPCQYCNSPAGHKAWCPLIIGHRTAFQNTVSELEQEAGKVAIYHDEYMDKNMPVFSEADYIAAHGMGIKL